MYYNKTIIMANTTIQINKSTKDLLDKIKDKHSINTYDICVHSMAFFILKNDINPKDEFVGDFKKSLIDLEMRLSKNFEELRKTIIKDNASIRKWVGGVEKDYFKPLIKKIGILDKVTDLEIDIKKDKIIENTKYENPINNVNNLDNSQSEDVVELKQKLVEKSEKYTDLYKEKERLKNILFDIINNSKTEKVGMLGKEKVVIDIDIEEWNKIKTYV